MTSIALIILCLGGSLASEVHYFIGPSQPQNNGDNHFAFSQLVDNFSNFLTNDTALIFLPGNYSLDSEIIVENIHSFSMFSWSGSSSKAVITCGHNAGFEFTNVSSVRVSGLELILNVHSAFTIYIYGVTIAGISDSEFISNIGSNVLRAENTSINITGSEFIGIGKVVSTSNGTILTINNCKFINNTGQTVLEADSGNMGINYCEFRGNENELSSIIYTHHGMMTSIAYSKFIDNSVSKVIQAESTSYVSIHHCEFSGNENRNFTVYTQYGVIISIDHSTFFRNNGNGSLYIDSASTINITHSEFTDNSATAPGPSTFLNGGVIQSQLVYLDGDIDMMVHSSEFTNNKASSAIVFVSHIPNTTTNNLLTNNVFIHNSAAYVVYIAPKCGPGLSLSLGSP